MHLDEVKVALCILTHDPLHFIGRFSAKDHGPHGIQRRTHEGRCTCALAFIKDFLPFESEPERDLDSRDRMSTISILEIRFYLGNILLRDPDVCGMAHGLEIRAPLLDHELADYMFSLPGKWRVIANATECLGIFLILYRTM